ncbi:MAG: hypothetical protein BWX93_01956 [Bacteroidetes bacterium ADurb.Bin139]|nr:MAG: hypothetical protein BWX93_01956 [Bacteroidetes bacterium ADurb.Bin139]
MRNFVFNVIQGLPARKRIVQFRIDGMVDGPDGGLFVQSL